MTSNIDGIVSKEAYRAFVTFMFSAAMIAWGATLLGVAGYLSSPNPPARPQGTAQPSDTTQPPDIKGFPNQIIHLVGGILYGCVIICMYWIYSEIISIKYMPTNIVMLLLDFITLTFTTGAAACWREESTFNILAIMTLVLLTSRFGLSTFKERATHHAFFTKAMIMTHLTGVYALCIVVFLIMVAGFCVISENYLTLSDLWKKDNFQSTVYKALWVGMFLGIVTTVLHTFRRGPIPKEIPMPFRPPIEYTEPVLVPAYNIIESKDRLRDVSKHIFMGEKRFRELLSNVKQEWTLPNNIHKSSVHAYRDVETQSFIMSSYSKNPQEIELRSMWVYLAHWFDDHFDDDYALQIAKAELKDDFDIEGLLNDLDPKLGDLWNHSIEITVKDTAANVNYWNSDFFKIGFRRMILGGPLFSVKCMNQQKKISEQHKSYILQKLPKEDCVSKLILNKTISDRYLNCTTKVVVELWNSFDRVMDFSTTMLMNLFYTPGLLFHDYEAEQLQNQISVDKSDSSEKFTTILKEHIFPAIYNLPQEKRAVAIRPTEMYVRSFENVLKKKNLLGAYEEFLDRS